MVVALSVVLAGHPKLKMTSAARLWKKLATELRFSLDNLISNQRDYIEWLLNAMAEGTQISDSLEVSTCSRHALEDTSKSNNI